LSGQKRQAGFSAGILSASGTDTGLPYQ